MTGFAEARVESGLNSVSITIRSVNHRSLDLKLRVPQRAARLEREIRCRIRQCVRRGSVQVSLDIKVNGPPVTHVDRGVVEAHLDAFRQVADLCGTRTRPDPNVLMRLPGALAVEGVEIPDDMLDELVRRCLDQALPAFDRSRAEEAKAMMSNLREHADAIEREVDAIKDAAHGVVELWRQRLQQQLEEILVDAEPGSDRIVQDAAHQAIRADVTEELLRLRAHVGSLRDRMDDASEIGKRIDFLAQEMNREANTLLSKIQCLGSQALGMTQAGLRIRAAIEKIREQAMNLE